MTPGNRLLRAAPALASAGAVVAIAATVASLLLYLDNSHHVRTSYPYGDVLAGVLYPCVGAFLVRRRPDNRVGWIFAATVIVGVNSFANQYAVSGYLVHHGLPFQELAAWIAAWGWAPELVVPVLLPLLFPDGKLPSRRWRPVARAAVSCLAFACVTLAISRHPIDASDQVFNPWHVTDGRWLSGVSIVGISGMLLLAFPALASLVLRTRRATGVVRDQLLWLQFSVVATVLLGTGGLVLPAPVDEAVWGLALAAIPVGVVVAVARHRLLDIDVVLNRTLTYALLTGVVVIAYVVAVAIVGEVAAKRLGIAAVAVVALVVASARDRVQRAVDRGLFGDRKDPYAVVDRLGQRVDAASDPVDALEQMALELRQALRLPSVAIVPDAPSLQRITTGTPVAGTVDVPISVHGRQVGVLRVGRRHRGERWRPEEQSVLLDVGRRAGALLQAATLVADLRSSRERIVTAREEERRRLRHDLHDGVGPQLAGLALQLDSLARRLGDDADNAGRVQLLRDRLRDTVVEVRRVVDNLRSPALDDVGLVEAVRQQLAAYAVPVSGEPAAVVEVVSAQALPPLSAAVEVAAYRIVTESVANAVRHGHPHRVVVTLDADDDALVLDVADDGTGIAPDASRGVGLTSMAERAAEVGGTFTVRTGGDGTTVTARLPLDRDVAEVAVLTAVPS